MTVPTASMAPLTTLKLVTVSWQVLATPPTVQGMLVVMLPVAGAAAGAGAVAAEAELMNPSEAWPPTRASRIQTRRTFLVDRQVRPQTGLRALLSIKERPGQGARSTGFEPATF